ncbi:type II toxin-antitoxin system prevent-host-death family antitoxin [Cyanobium sp. FGCU-52]|nr:type II toxin-antitoxin system prevent-host-death family antitoxin [Cyanobium sp. FGCU52]
MEVNLHDAKTHLSRYVDQALAGEEVVIARDGKTLVRLMPVVTDPPPRCHGFLSGTARVEADLKRDFEAEINAMFELDEVPAPPLP